MAIRPQQIGSVDYGASNSLLLNAQNMITQGLDGVGTAVETLRNAKVANNTATALGALAQVRNQGQLAGAQNQVNQTIQQSGGDIDLNSIIKAQAALPDTLANRQLGDMKLKAAATAQHDAPLAGQYMAAVMQGDTSGARNLLSQFQGDASDALKFAADYGVKQQQLGIQKQELGLRAAALSQQQEAAKQRAAQANGLMKMLPQLLNTGNVLQGKSEARDAQAATERAQTNLKEDPLNNPKLDLKSWVAKNPNGMFGLKSGGEDVYNVAKDQPGFKNLSKSQQINLLDSLTSGLDSKPGSQSLKDFVTSGITDASKRINGLQIDNRRAQDAQDVQSVTQSAQDRLNNFLFPYLLQQQ